MLSKVEHITAAGSVRMLFGPGSVVLSERSGAPVQFFNPRDPARRYLLDARTPWHSVEHEWGAGHLVTNLGAGRWNHPQQLHSTVDGMQARFGEVGGLIVRVERSVRGDEFIESFTFRNDQTVAVEISALGIQVPFADVYEDSTSALRSAVHAHVFTGGTWCWVAAQPMSGSGPVLGLILRRGQVASYSVESRNVNTLSNARGHLVLNVTDAARNPTAFGGQSTITLAPGARLELEWSLSWFDTVADLVARTRPPVSFDRLAAPVGEAVRMTPLEPVSVVRGSGVEVTADANDLLLVGSTHGVVDLRIDGAATRVLFHLEVEELVRRRVRYILDHQRSGERPGVLAHAFVPTDTTTGLTSSTNGWSDWTDGSERIAMPIILQLAAERGWADTDEVDIAIDGWLQFAREHLMDETLAPRRGSQDEISGSRLYDSPWLAEVFLNRFRSRSDEADLRTAVAILDRAAVLGADRHLAIGRSRTVMAVAEELDGVGDGSTAARLRAGLVESAQHFLAIGLAIPEHEVAYEQAIVAPLVDLMIDAYRITGDERFLDAVAERLPWLLAFGGPQPDVRTHGIALRHWDGYWFGTSRLFGDVFPHYWSVLTAVVLARLPDSLRTAATARLAHDIMVANLANFRADGSATCAFVMPSTVDGRAGYLEDPLANDQDWHLALWLDLNRREGVELA